MWFPGLKNFGFLLRNTKALRLSTGLDYGADLFWEWLIPFLLESFRIAAVFCCCFVASSLTGSRAGERALYFFQ